MTQEVTKRILIYGAGAISQFLPYVKSLIGKSNPRMCLLPTAVADNPYTINNWYEQCANLAIAGFVQRMFISSYEQKQSFEDVLLSMDAILVTGGNTLNMLAIWKAQGVDVVLRKAWEKGILLSGGSAGSLCWFEHGTTDSRPKEITTVDCLGFLPGSHCPHYDSEKTRRPLYHSYIKSKVFKPGYACDDRAAILFHNHQVHKVIALNEESNAYYVYIENDEVQEKKFDKEIVGSYLSYV
jgi:dipeptidase E